MEAPGTTFGSLAGDEWGSFAVGGAGGVGGLPPVAGGAALKSMSGSRQKAPAPEWTLWVAAPELHGGALGTGLCFGCGGGMLLLLAAQAGAEGELVGT